MLATPLYEAVKKDDVLKTKHLLNLGADPHYIAKKLVRGWPSNIKNKNSASELASQLGNQTLPFFKKMNLISEAEKGNLNILHKSSLQQLEIVRDGQTSWSLLHVAANRDNVEVAKLLLDKGMSPNILNKFQQTPAHLAAFRGSLNVLELLVNQCNFDGRIVDDKGMTYLNWLATLLYEAVLKNDVRKTESLLSLGADPDYLARQLHKGWPTFQRNKKSARDLAFDLQNHTLPLLQKMNLISEAEKGNLNILHKSSLQQLEIVRDGQTSWSLLHVAANRDNVEVAKLLLDKGMSPNILNKFQQTPAHLAAFRGSLNVLELLVNQCNFDGRIVDDKGMTYLNWLATLLYEAVLKNDVRKTESLLSLGADPDYLARQLRKGWPTFQRNKKSARDLAFDLQNHTLPLLQKVDLIHEAEMGNLASLEELSLEQLENVIDKRTKWTLLHAAAHGNRTEVAKVLLNKGMSPNTLNKYQQTPAHLAAFRGNLNVLEILINHCGFNGNQVDEKGMTYLDWLATPLYVAVVDGNIRMIKELLRLGANPDCYARKLYKGWPTQYRNRYSARDLAYELRNDTLYLFQKIDLLTEAERGNVVALNNMPSSKLNVKDRRTGWNLLHAAVNGNQVEVVKLLLSRGLAPNEVNNYEQTPAHLAAFKGYLDVLDVLLKNNCHLFEEIRDKSGMTYKDWLSTPLFEAVKKGNKKQAEQLLNHGADSDYKSRILYRGWPTQYHNKESAYDLAHRLRNDTIQLFQQVTRKTEAIEERHTYQMDKNAPGYVCILNYEHFEKDPFIWRKGTDKDVDRINNLFTHMGYTCITYSDLTTEETIKKIKELQNDIVDDTRCLILFLLSHGDHGNTFYTYDGTLTTNEVQELFTENQCLKLRDKPKLFFFQFCRGDYFEDGRSKDEIPLNCIKRSKVDNVAKKEPFKDMWCLYSSVEDFVSTRDAELGTPFIRAVCQAIEKCAWDKDLIEIFYEFLEINETISNSTLPEMKHFAFKRFFFHPKGKKDSKNQFSLSHLR